MSNNVDKNFKILNNKKIFVYNLYYIYNGEKLWGSLTNTTNWEYTPTDVEKWISNICYNFNNDFIVEYTNIDTYDIKSITEYKIGDILIVNKDFCTVCTFKNKNIQLVVDIIQQKIVVLENINNIIVDNILIGNTLFSIKNSYLDMINTIVDTKSNVITVCYNSVHHANAIVDVSLDGYSMLDKNSIKFEK